MEKNNKLKVMSISFQGEIILKNSLSTKIVENLLDDLGKIHWEFINEPGKSGCERPPRLIGKMENGPSIIIYHSGKFQIFGAKTKKQAELLFEVAIKQIRNSKNTSKRS